MHSTQVVPRWRDDIHYGWLTWFVVVHGVGFAGVVYAVAVAPWQTVVFTVVYFLVCHLSITCGAHRLYAHGSYQARPLLQYAYQFFFAATWQGPMLWWVAVHRRHHQKTGMLDDVHDPDVYGFLRAYIGWMCMRAGVAMPGITYLAHTADKKPYIFWQFRNYWKLAFIAGFGVPFALCALWGDYVGGVLVGGFARLLFQYHFTWAVNTFCHMFGEHVDGAGTATNIPLLGLFTVGESYHANHHKDPMSWKLGSRRRDLDPGKWAITFFMKVGLASPRK